jgi:trigger factor
MADASPPLATPETEIEKPTYDVHVEDIGPARKRLTITVPAEAISEKLEVSLSTLATETAVPGFRKGRVPRALLERRFGSAVKSETRNQIVAEAYAAAIEDKSIKPVGDPEPDKPLDELEMEPGKPLTFSVDVEVVPEFDLPSLEGIEIKKPILEITDEHINTEVERQCMNFGTSNKIEGDFEKGDRIHGYATATRKGDEKPFFQHDDVLVTHPGDEDGGRGQVLGLLIDGLSKMLKGKSVGDTLEITTTGPEQHEREDIRGKEITIAFQIRHAERIEPAPVQTVVDGYGLGSEEVLRQQIRIALEDRLRREQISAMHDQVYQHLAEQTSDFDLPEKLSAAQAQRLLTQYEMDLLGRGTERQEVDRLLAEARAESEESAKRRLKVFFLMHKLAEHFKIEVSDSEVNGFIAQMAGQHNTRPEQLRNDLVRTGRLSEVALQVRDAKTADRILQQAKVSDISTEEWQKILAEKRGTRRQKPAAKASKPKTGGGKKKAAAKTKDE